MRRVSGVAREMLVDAEGVVSGLLPVRRTIVAAVIAVTSGYLYGVTLWGPLLSAAVLAAVIALAPVGMAAVRPPFGVGGVGGAGDGSGAAPRKPPKKTDQDSEASGRSS